ncbi:MAG: hypothetical protein K0S74_573 [Chlamydiales bacterium]|jgi:putative N6-adenine-specific DNA methylase|nr:hypothetical protein [Chlamydiales bacterium]
MKNRPLAPPHNFLSGTFKDHNKHNKKGFTSSLFKLFVSCAHGLEELLLKELQNLGYKSLKKQFSGVMVEDVALKDIYRINYSSRLANRVLLPLISATARSRDELYAVSQKIDWLSYISLDKTFAIDANVNHSKAFRNSLFAAQVVKDAICDQFRQKFDKRPSIERYEPDIQINLYIERDLVTLSLDTSGSPLHKRGYRKKTGVAPLQETLAAALLISSGYSAEETLCDPCCGSGTLLIEAALIASNTAPGFLREKWGFYNLQQFSEQEWEVVKGEIDSQRRPLKPGHFYGIDMDYNTLEACKLNIEAAGLTEYMTLHRCDFARSTPDQNYTFLITNPPYGKRLEERELLPSLYRRLGTFIKKNMTKPAKAYVFTMEEELGQEVGYPIQKQKRFFNGGLETRLIEYTIS